MPRFGTRYWQESEYSSWSSSTSPCSPANDSHPFEDATRRSEIAQRHDDIDRALVGTSTRVTGRFRSIPAIPLLLDAEGLSILERHPSVARIREQEKLARIIREEVALVN